jgi:hypothetical protein
MRPRIGQGRDTIIAGVIKAQSEIMKKPGDPNFVPPGVKLESTTSVNATIKNGKFTYVRAVIISKKFESPVLWGLDPAFTKVRNKSSSISPDGQVAKIHYDVVTQLSNFEVIGQWGRTIINDGTIQTNVITVTQSIDIELRMGSISTTFDGSTFPESRYKADYTVNTGTKVLKGNSFVTLQQSSYYEAVKEKTFRERNHPQKARKVLTY